MNEEVDPENPRPPGRYPRFASNEWHYVPDELAQTISLGPAGDGEPGQIVNEFEEMIAIERERGRESQGPNSSKNLLESEGDAKTRAAKKINADVSGETLRKGKKVKDKAESDDEPAEVREAAREAWDGTASVPRRVREGVTTPQQSRGDTGRLTRRSRALDSTRGNAS